MLIPPPVKAALVPPPVKAEAEVMHKAMTSGRNRAVLLGCRTPSGAMVECVVKFAVSFPGFAPVPYLFEWVATALGRLVGVNVPAPFEVAITPAFAQSLDPQWRDVAARSLGSAFGCAHHAGGLTQWLPGMLIPVGLRAAAMDLVAFDVFVHNPDRRIDNPNLLASREKFLAIDHDAAFSWFYAIGQKLDPAEDPLLTQVVDRHVFSNGWGRTTPTADGFRDGLVGISDQHLQEIGQSTPAAWQSGPAAGKVEAILDVMKRRRDAIDKWLPLVEARVR